MNYRFVTYSIGKLLQVLAGVMIIPAIIGVFECLPCSMESLFYDTRFYSFIIAIVASFITGTILVMRKPDEEIGNSVREGFSIVTFGWILLTIFGAIPLFCYFLALEKELTSFIIFRCFTDAFFEIMSGFSTTGSTILTDIEALPKSLHFWRSTTHWLGGMGIVTLALSIFPAFGVTAYQMFRGEVPGPTAERLRPRLDQTAKVLWGVYATLTLVQAILLWFGGMTVFDAICHAFGTLATGGFSTKADSVAAYNSAYIDWVIIIFMFFAGMNFILHYHILFNKRLAVLKTDREFHFYTIVVVSAIIFGTVVLQVQGLSSERTIRASYRHVPLTDETYKERSEAEAKKIETIGNSVRYMAFQVLAIVTTTGFCTADFDMWPNILKFMLVVLMFFGGCAGSTGGGMKMVRLMVVLKTAVREVRTMIQPRLIAPVKIADKALEEKQVANIVGFFMLFILLFVFFAGVMCFIIDDFTTAVTSVTATMCNIGPGLSGVGATENFAWIPVSGKWILSFCMLLGRLEIFTVLIAVASFTSKK